MTYTFPKVSWFRRGYSVSEVDEFFREARAAYEGGIPAEQFSAADVSRVVFSDVHGGYETHSVDAALARMTRAFIVRDRDDHIAMNGKQAWMEKISRRATTLYPRMLRPYGERFRHPQGRGYNIEEVDFLVDRLAEYFDKGVPLSVSDVSNALFTQARGDKAYDPAVVDAYLDRAIEILHSVA